MPLSPKERRAVAARRKQTLARARAAQRVRATQKLPAPVISRSNTSPPMATGTNQLHVVQLRPPPQQLYTRAQLSRAARPTVQFAPRGHGYYDAFANRPDAAATAVAIGPCTQVSGTGFKAVTAAPAVTGQIPMKSGTQPEVIAYGSPVTLSSKLIMFNPGASDSAVGKLIYWAAGTSVTVNGASVTPIEAKTSTFTCSQFKDFGPTRPTGTAGVGAIDANWIDGASDTANFDPTRRIANLPLRGSVRIRNLSERVGVGGAVRILRLNAGVQLNHDAHGASDDASADADPFMVSKFMNMMRQSTRTQVLTGHELMECHQVNSYPVDFIRSMSFERDYNIHEAMQDPSFCTVAILIDDFVSGTASITNTYEINYHVQRAARYSPDTVLGGMMKNMRVAQEMLHKQVAAMSMNNHAAPLKDEPAPEVANDPFYKGFY